MSKSTLQLSFLIFQFCISINQSSSLIETSNLKPIGNKWSGQGEYQAAANSRLNQCVLLAVNNPHSIYNEY